MKQTKRCAWQLLTRPECRRTFIVSIDRTRAATNWSFRGEANWCNLLLHLTNTYVCDNFGGGSCPIAPLWLPPWIELTTVHSTVWRQWSHCACNEARTQAQETVGRTHKHLWACAISLSHTTMQKQNFAQSDAEFPYASQLHSRSLPWRCSTGKASENDRTSPIVEFLKVWMGLRNLLVS